MKRFLILVLALTVLPWATGAEDSPHIRFGIFAAKQAGKPNQLATETLTIPLKVAATGFRWGYDVSPPDASEQYTHRAVVYLPRPPAAVTGSLQASQDSPTIVKTPTYRAKGRDDYVFTFDAGDPLGEWKIEIFVNDRLTRTFKFQVVKAE
jgi:hypothetical protein